MCGVKISKQSKGKNQKLVTKSMMPWLIPSWSELKKKVLRYLLNRYLGQFLEEKLTLDQLSVDFFKGTGTVKDVTLQSQVC